MLSAILMFVLLLLLICGLSTLTVGSLLMRLNSDRYLSRIEIVLYSLGIGPMLAGLLLWYLLLLFGGISSFWALGSYAIVLVALISVNYAGFRRFVQQAVLAIWPFSFRGELPPVVMDSRLSRAVVFNSEKSLQLTVSGFGRSVLVDLEKLALMLVVNWFCDWWLAAVFRFPINSHDMLEYAIQANVFAKDMSIQYVQHRFDSDSMFYYVGLHGFTFPLLGTWEAIVNRMIGIHSDFFFRSITGYYGLLNLAICFVWMRKIGRKIAIVTVLALLLAYGFFESMSSYHIDSMRINSILLCFIFFGYLINRWSTSGALVLGAVLGLSASIHSMNAFIAVAVVGLTFLFAQISLKQRFVWAIAMFGMLLLFGGLHYVLDVITGTGWILKEITDHK